ncbi:MAG: hypothetical protein H0V31_01590 [Acidobacteria bacterium]|jgi:hypothetical protein|nr:hypothetical protein [Acidobacteriota bacterium]
MSQIVLSQIEQNILQLPVDEQLLLISQVAEKLRKKVETQTDFENQLSGMANDANIQRELKEIEEDFRQTELDGLEQ